MGFCPECGTKVEAAVKPVETAVEPIEIAVQPANETIYCPECGAKATSDSAYCPECSKPFGASSEIAATAEAVVTTVPAPGPINIPTNVTSKLRIKPLYVGIAAVAVVLIAAVAYFVMWSGSGSSSSPYVLYAKDNELQFSYASDAKPFELTERLSSDSDLDASDFMSVLSFIRMSDNERYMFYPDRADDDGVTYYWRDLKADNAKSDAAVKVDSEIKSIPYLTKDGNKLFYIKGDDQRLYVYDRKSGEKSRLDDDVESFYVNDAGDYLIYDTYADEEYSIYESNLKGIEGEKNKIDSNSEIYLAYPNDKKLYYLKDDETLYFKQSGKDNVKIASEINRMVSVVNDNSIYYAKIEEVTNKLANFINDDMAASDQSISQPAEPQYPVEPTYPTQSDYQEQVWVDSYWGNDRHPTTNNWGYWSTETDYDAYNAAYAAYQEDYAAWEQSFTQMRDEYYAAYEVYEGRQFRDNLREALNDEANAVTYNKYLLYHWSNGAETLVASDLSGPYSLTSSSKASVVIYQKYSQSSADNQKLSELLSDGNVYIDNVLSDIQSKVTATRAVSDDVYAAVGAKESVMEWKNPRSVRIEDKAIYFLDEYNAEKGYGVLMSAAISGESVAKPVKLDEDVAEFLLGNGNDNVYYFKDEKDSSGDLYLNGKMIAADVLTTSIYNYSGTDTLLYYKDYSDKSETGTLSILKGGKESKIADDVSSFSVIDAKSVGYLTDYNRDREKGDLMLYNGGSKPVRVDSDVTALLWSPKMVWNKYNYYDDYEIF